MSEKKISWSTAAWLSRGLRFSVAVIAAALPVVFAQADLVYTWGYNDDGQLGDGTTTNRTSPIAVAGSVLNGVTAVAAGGVHSLAVQNGGVYAWGYNASGQVGDGTTTERKLPVALTGALSSGVTAIAGGTGFSLAVQNGGVYAWGFNNDGQLGDGTTTQRNSPVALSGALSSGVTAVAGGLYHSLALQSGCVYAWGYNNYGQLGNGTTTLSKSPVALTGAVSSGVTAIAAGLNHSLALQSGGVYIWGQNNYGQLGDGTTTQEDAPIALTGPLSSGVTAIAAGEYHSLAVRNGGVYAWGYNAAGQLGDGTQTNRSTPAQVDPTVLTNIVSVAASVDSSFALSSDGSLWVWGDNGEGELGLGNTTQYTTPQHLLAPSGYTFTSINAESSSEFAVATVAPIPEPTSLSLIAIAAGSLLIQWRRRVWSV